MTTTSIPLTDLPGNGPEPRRDRWGRYLVRPPGGDTPVGYTRVTTVAKTLDSGGGLGPWKATMAVQGVMLRKGLRAQWEALMAEHNGDPWYDGEDSKAKCKQLVEEACAAVGGANDRRDDGLEPCTPSQPWSTSSRTPTQLTEETAADGGLRSTGLVEAGISIEASALPRPTVVLDSWQVAGTFDRLVSVPGFDLPLIADLKTGASLEQPPGRPSPCSSAAYSRASDAIYVQVPRPTARAEQATVTAYLA